jgi:hypothetical protein
MDRVPRAGPGSRKRPRVTTPKPLPRVIGFDNTTGVTVTRLADYVADGYRRQWWGEHYMWTWGAAELSRYVA